MLRIQLISCITTMLYHRERRQRVKNVMKGTKQQWEFPQKKRTTQNLVDNAISFEKEILGPEEDAYLQIQNNMNGLLK